MTFWGIIILAIGNIIGGILIHKGGKKTTKEFFDESNKKTEESIGKIANPYQDLHELIISKHKSDFDDYYDAIQELNSLIVGKEDIISGKLKIEGGESLDISNVVNPAIDKKIKELHNNVLTKWKKVNSSLESIKILLLRIDKSDVKQLVDDYILKVERQKTIYSGKNGTEFNSQLALPALKEAKKSLFEMAFAVGYVKNK